MIGATPLRRPKLRNIFPLVDSFLTPERAMTLINAPAPIDIIIKLKSLPSTAPNFFTERTGSMDSKDIVKPQWRNAIKTMALNLESR